MRADFLRPDVMRPYGATAPETFQALCDGCGDCVKACPEEIIFRGEDGKAQIDLTRSVCTFCEVCVEVCPTGALTADALDDWDWVAQPKETCLSIQGVTCRTCEDFCDHRAIRFRLETGGRSRPQIDKNTCTGCGACASGCPAGAIAFARKTPEQREVTG